MGGKHTKHAAHRDVQTQDSKRQKDKKNPSHRINVEPQAMHSDSRVLRCFCGCSPLTYEQIEQIAMMNVATMVRSTQSKSLLQTFLSLGHENDKSEVTSLLECYEMCDRFLDNLQLLRDAKSVRDLLELCPSYTWEQKITDAIENDKHNHSNEQLCRVLNDLRVDCVHSIECHQDYARFRLELLRKIGKK